ncbi:ChaN family lipoprotein [Thalassospira marina]|uniref:Haem-binding uptake Tiki superfamily ChaN domain-containing protein n=1 Tax=Thalassospira marina TaxID=2048283 RepID=A0ABM6Q7W0_9PROT|nr:ChaN family lipoprotein [Thalassospira marina]AUG52632.1 hypothetical protein CSC3H3_07815 [Thalassospira marina]
MPTIHNKPQAGKTGWPFFVYLLIVLCIGVVSPSRAANSFLGPMSPAPGLIYDVAKGDYVRLETLQSAAAGAKYILLGETHDNLIHHQRQAELVDVLSGDGLKRAVVWEMINRDQQAALDAAWNDRKIEIEDIGAQLNWEDSGWPSWHDYSPIADAARKNQLPMAAGNLPDALISPLMTKGNSALPVSLAKKLALPALPDDTKALFDQEIVDAHCGMLAPEQAPPFSTIQFARDASLARAMFDATHQKGIKGAFLIAGAMHVRANVAVPWHLKRFDPKGTSIVIAMIEAPNPGDANIMPDELLNGFGPGHSVDFIWFTSDLDRSDPCDGVEMPHVQSADAQKTPAGDTDSSNTGENADDTANSDADADASADKPDTATQDAATNANSNDNGSAKAKGSPDTAVESPAKATNSGQIIDPEPSNNPMRRIMPIPPARPKE